MIDWDVFDKEYPVRDGIVYTTEKALDYKVEAKGDAKHFFDVHGEVMAKHKGEDFLGDKKAMASMQKDFYDRMAVGFQSMDDEDLKHGGIFFWKIQRLAKYDEQFFKRGKILFVGAGNCRFAKIFVKMGYQVVATDISENMLKIGKERCEREGVEMTYVVQNAENPFPFKSEVFSTAYSLCVINHIVDWNNYLSEKMRCLSAGGVLLERMPNFKKIDFWKQQGELNEGVEIKARECYPDSVRVTLRGLGLQGEVWTHDRQVKIDAFGRGLPIPFRRAFSKAYYRLRTFWEDEMSLGAIDDEEGIYTILKINKEGGS